MPFGRGKPNGMEEGGEKEGSRRFFCYSESPLRGVTSVLGSEVIPFGTQKKAEKRTLHSPLCPKLCAVSTRAIRSVLVREPLRQVRLCACGSR